MGSNYNQHGAYCFDPVPNNYDYAGGASQHTVLTIDNANAIRHPARLSPYSGSIWKMSTDTKKVDTKNLGDVCAWLAWKDLIVKVLNHKGKTQTILDNLTGFAKPGHFTTTMGPSGSGKSTLSDTLAGKASMDTLEAYLEKVPCGFVAIHVTLGYGKKACNQCNTNRDRPP